MKHMSNNTKRYAGTAIWRVATAAVLACLPTIGHATNYNEGAVQYRMDANGYFDPYEANDLSSNPSLPTNIGALTLGSNIITGATIPYGPISNVMTGERQFQDNDYLTFTVPTGDVLSKLLLVAPSASTSGTSITAGDLFFIGLASGSSVSVTPPSSSGLLGYTLASSGVIGTDILPAIGKASPPGFSGPPFTGATTFSAPLSAGTYSLWLLDGDNPVSYQLDLQVASVPESATWAMMIIGFGMTGVALRRRARASAATA